MTLIIPSDTPTRTCTKCRDTFPATTDYFHRDSHNKRNGLQAQCRVCRNAYMVARKNRILDAAQSLTYRQQLRRDLLTHYGGNPPSCACCGEHRTAFLAIDHIGGGGAAHRRVLGKTNSIYQWIRKNGYPEGFRVLCHNCNCAIGFYGHCPHEDERTIEADAG